ncbi:hypothetical protein CYV19_01420 [Natronobacterium gregoryi SP2]|uniref:Uncharacterized protein n=1 Tax=Natronobacterium gregoryi (strain ATCC 43098 / DSM 3393 / CCM 3738 / CIP 104747 / IAM 13177 / JCM 8860 / NBRC 102187 / NCIMB 2189 / SP2) TaxID=797304 RepID=A0A2J4JJJ1_NATGS|nr:hypothetical protein CYV19_01420 [Natronobacterium gregoryi SP2]
MRSSGFTQQSTLGGVLVPSQPSTDGSNRATPPDSTHQFRLGPPLVVGHACTAGSTPIVSTGSTRQSAAETVPADTPGAVQTTSWQANHRNPTDDDQPAIVAKNADLDKGPQPIHVTKLTAGEPKRQSRQPHLSLPVIYKIINNNT